MFERYNDQARRVLFFARYEAGQLGGLSIEAEHILLGLIRDGAGLTARLFDRLQLSPETIRHEIESRTRLRDKVTTAVEIPFSTATQRVLTLAAEEADRLAHQHIGSEHLLLGIVGERESVAASILASHGMTLETAREDLVQLLNEDDVEPVDPDKLKLKLSGYTTPAVQLFRNVLFDQLYSSLPKDPQVKVQIYNAEIAPGGYTNWHCHNGATFFVALQGIFEAEFQEGILVKAKAGDVYSEPIAKFHRGHNPHASLPYLCIGFCVTSPDREHVTNVPQRPW